MKELVSLRRMLSCRRNMTISSSWWTASSGTVRRVREGCTGEVSPPLSIAVIFTNLPPGYMRMRRPRILSVYNNNFGRQEPNSVYRSFVDGCYDFLCWSGLNSLADSLARLG